MLISFRRPDFQSGRESSIEVSKANVRPDNRDGTVMRFNPDGLENRATARKV
jgi:hypothetical protein